ncbi:MAG: ATP synthase F0 subunit B [Candidatus Acidiferrales bacterium]
MSEKRLAARSCRPALACCCLWFLLTAAPLLAEEGAPGPENSPSGWIFRWINFAIVFSALVYFFTKVAAPSLRERSKEISKKIAEGARAREAAQQQRREVQRKLAGIGKEVESIRADAKRDADAEAVRLRALARLEAEVIERAAQAEIRAAQRAAQLELKAFAARLAVDRAEGLLTDQMTPEAQSSLFHTFVAELDRSTN